jgi:hypothetical protein
MKTAKPLALAGISALVFSPRAMRSEEQESMALALRCTWGLDA